MKHHLRETHIHNFQAHNIVLSSQFIHLNVTYFFISFVGRVQDVVEPGGVPEPPLQRLPHPVFCLLSTHPIFAMCGRAGKLKIFVLLPSPGNPAPIRT